MKLRKLPRNAILGIPRGTKIPKGDFLGHRLCRVVSCHIPGSARARVMLPTFLLCRGWMTRTKLPKPGEYDLLVLGLCKHYDAGMDSNAKTERNLSWPLSPPPSGYIICVIHTSLTIVSVSITRSAPASKRAPRVLRARRPGPYIWHTHRASSRFDDADCGQRAHPHA